MSNSKFKSIFTPERSSSPQRALSPGMERALKDEVGQLAKETVSQELRQAVIQLANNSSKFFSNFQLSQDEKWDQSNPFLRNVPASLDLKLIVGLPKSTDYEKAMSDFLPLLNNLAQVGKIIDQVDGDFPFLEESDKLYDLAIRATLLSELTHKYSRFFYQQLKEASARNEKLDQLKQVEQQLFLISFPKFLHTLVLENKINPSFAKKEQLKTELSSFFEEFDQLCGQYRRIQRDLFDSYSTFVNFGPEVLPSQIEIENDTKFWFRKPLINVIRNAVQDLMRRVRGNYDQMIPQRIPGDGREQTYNDKVEDHLQSILSQVEELGGNVLKGHEGPAVPTSLECLTVADESLISYQALVTRQIEDLQSAHLRHMMSFEDKLVPRDELPSTEFFVDSLFNLENIVKLSYDQIGGAEGVIQRYLSSSGLQYDFQSVARLLDSITSLKQLWSVSQGDCQKSRLLLSAFQKKSSVNDNAQRSVLSRCSLPEFPSNGARSPLDYCDWRQEWTSLIKSISDEGQKLRLLRQSLESHKFAKSLVRFCKTAQEALLKLDSEFAQRSSLGVRISKEVHSIGLSGDSLQQESRNIRRFLDLCAQLEFNSIDAAQTLGVSAILHVCNSLVPAHESEYIARRTEMNYDLLTIEKQFSDFSEYLEGLLKKNTAILQSRNLRAVLTSENGNQKPGQGPYNGRHRDLPNKPKDQKVLNNQNNNFEKKGHKPKVPSGPPKTPGSRGPFKENKSCQFCGLAGHNQFGKCQEIMSRLLDQPSLLKEVEKRNLCLSCLHKRNNDGNTHSCRDTFRVRDKDGKEVTKSVFCKKLCRGPGNVRLHSRLCHCAAEEYRKNLKTLQNKAIELRPKLRSENKLLASGNVVNKTVIDVNVSGAAGLATSTADNNEGAAKCDEHSPSSTTAAVVNLGAGKLISAEIALGREGSHNDGAEPEKTNLINGSAIGECCRLSQQIILTNDNRSRTVGILYDGGSTNTVVSPEEADLTTESWVLDESFDLVTQGHSGSPKKCP